MKTEMNQAPLREWSWTSPRCIALYAEAIAKRLRPTELVEYINERLPRDAQITSGMISGERNRRLHFERVAAFLGEEGRAHVEYFYEKKPMSSRTPTEKQRNAHQNAIRLVPRNQQTAATFRKPRNVEAKKPIADPAARAASEGIERYLAGLRARDERRRLFGDAK